MSTYRVIALTAPAPHFIHAFKLVRRVGDVEYQACRCGTRRIVVGPKAKGYDSGWLRTGEFAAPELRLIRGMAAREERLAA